MLGEMRGAAGAFAIRTIRRDFRGERAIDRQRITAYGYWKRAKPISATPRENQ
jgi:NADPH-dependent ferric siderophore reductase